jgi:hypothetical protein
MLVIARRSVGVAAAEQLMRRKGSRVSTRIRHFGLYIRAADFMGRSEMFAGPATKYELSSASEDRAKQ